MQRIKTVRPALWLLPLLICLACLPAHADIAALGLNDPAPAPQEKYFLSDTHYEDPSITVDIGKGRIHDTDYVYAVVAVASPAQIRTAMAYKYNSGLVVPGETMARANNAVLAMNADYHNYYDYGYLVRQGVEYRVRPNRDWDTLMIDQNGDMHALIAPTDETLADWRSRSSDITVVNSFNFGPVFKVNGQWQPMDEGVPRNYYYVAGAVPSARTAVCQLDRLTYLLVSCESAMDGSSAGMTLAQFEDCLKEIEGKLDGYEIQLAYNLDGGRSSTLVFNNRRVNSPASNKTRDLSDIIYFATAWEE